MDSLLANLLDELQTVTARIDKDLRQIMLLNRKIAIRERELRAHRQVVKQGFNSKKRKPKPRQDAMDLIIDAMHGDQS